MSSRIILIKNTSATQTYRLLGVPIPPGGEISFTSYSFAGLADSSVLRNGVTLGDLIVSDGVTDYDQLDGIAYIVNQVSTNPIFIGREGMRFPNGTTEERPQNPMEGQIRINTSTTQLEFYLGGEWRNIISIPAAPGQNVLDRIEDKDHNTFIDVDVDDTGLIDQIQFTTAGQKAFEINNDGSIKVFSQGNIQPSFQLVSSGAGAVKLTVPNITDDVEIILPATIGSANQVLTTNGQGATFWSTPSEGGLGSKTYLDTLLTGTGVSVDDGVVESLIGVNTRYAPFVISNFNLVGDRCRWDVKKIETGETFEGLRFASVNDIANWMVLNLNTNNGRFIEHATFKPYDEFDPNIPTLNKVRGFNHFFASVKGGGNYLARKSTALEANDWNYTETFLQMFRYAFPNDPVIQNLFPDIFNNSSFKACVWVCQNYKTLYGMPKPGSIVNGSDGVRSAIDSNGNAVIAGSNFTLRKPKIAIWKGMNKDAEKEIFWLDSQQDIRERQAWELENGPAPPNWIEIQSASETQIRKKLMTDSSSAVLVYPVTFGDQKAIYIKPLGIDTVFTNWVDRSQYWIESVFFGADSQPYKFQNIPEEQIYRERESYDDLGLTKGAFLWNGIRSRDGTPHGGWNRPPRCYFRLRDKNTLRVGPLSLGYVMGDFAGELSPLSFMAYSKPK